MKSFHFSLEKIYELRVKEEKKMKRAYGEIQKLVFQKENEIQQMMKEKATMSGMSQMNIEQIQVHYRYLARLDQQIMDEHQQLLIIKQQLADILEEYMTAQKDRKIIEKLYEKKYQEYLSEVKKEEQKRLDEFRARQSVL
ncbi:flagellar export protein FliJ [Enterococcus italicus]|uniref:flagellar export protein FliJ n=1 Tax=Enterococcus italicus TaxID=246144 RepID=UPI0028AA4CFE|nr:flagellar export protein FliJ [Enterococcus italicus]